jgi:glycosyltransferase involved in cell wall biosynthesis
MNVQMASMATQLGVPYIISPRGSLSDWPLSHKRLRKRIFALTVGRAMLKQASAFHFTALDEQHQSQAHVHGAQKFIAPNLIDLTNYSPTFDADLIQTSCEIDTEDIVLLFMGRLVPNKGVHLIIRALTRVRAAFPRIRLVIAGSGDAGDAKRLADEMGVSSIVRFVGFADGQLKRSLLARASLLVLPSRTENFANVLFEAAASGTRSLISRHVNTWQELVAAGASQIIDLSPDSIAEGILNELQRSVDERRSRDQHALAWAQNFYSADRAVKLYEQAYLDILSKRRC